MARGNPCSQLVAVAAGVTPATGGGVPAVAKRWMHQPAANLPVALTVARVAQPAVVSGRQEFTHESVEQKLILAREGSTASWLRPQGSNRTEQMHLTDPWGADPAAQIPPRESREREFHSLVAGRAGRGVPEGRGLPTPAHNTARLLQSTARSSIEVTRGFENIFARAGRPCACDQHLVGPSPNTYYVSLVSHYSLLTRVRQ